MIYIIYIYTFIASQTKNKNANRRNLQGWLYGQEHVLFQALDTEASGGFVGNFLVMVKILLCLWRFGGYGCQG